MNDDHEKSAEEALAGGWEAARRRKLTLGLSATAAERLAWLESMIALAWASGALPRKREPPSSVR